MSTPQDQAITVVASQKLPPRLFHQPNQTDSLAAPLQVQVSTPSVAAAKALRNLHGDDFIAENEGLDGDI